MGPMGLFIWAALLGAMAYMASQDSFSRSGAERLIAVLLFSGGALYFAYRWVKTLDETL